MRRIYETGQFRSLTYRDMPFVLAPNLWGTFSRPSVKPGTAKERAHGDGVLVDYDSPEALDEVYWRIFCGDSYLHPDRLTSMQADDEAIEGFRAYVNHILMGHGDKRYLSKNNNNILRLNSISRAFPNAVFLIPFRHPASQARSLHKQHLRFSVEHEQDDFSRRYMSWLAHHEFGSDHRPFVFEAVESNYRPSTLDYWIQLWTGVLHQVLATLPDNANLVCYERLCDETAVVWPLLVERLALPDEAATPEFVNANRTDDAQIQSKELAPALRLYEELRARSL